MKNALKRTGEGIVRIASILSVTGSTRPYKIPEPRYPASRNR